MQVMNEVIQLAQDSSAVDKNEEDDQISNFKDFDSFVSKIFDKVYDPLWMKKKTKTKDESIMKESMNMLLNEKVIKDLKGSEQI